MFALHRSNLAFRLATLSLAAGAAAISGVIQASAQDLPAFTCTNKAGGGWGASGTVANSRFAHHDGYDRLVIGFATANSKPQSQLPRQSSATFAHDASGQPVTLEGSAGIRAVLQNSDVTNGVLTDAKPRLPEIREVANIGNFERVVSYGIGLKTAACFRVLELSGPARLVIDVQTPPDVTASAAPAATTSAAPSTAATASAVPSDLAATGHPPSAGQ